MIMLGGLAYDWFEEDGGPFVREFLDDVLNAWGGRYFDILAFHYYPAFDYNWSDYGPGIIGKASYLQRRMQWHHVYKPLLSSESGWHSNFDSSPTIQSQQVVKIMARSVVFGLEATIWFRLTDSANYPYYNGLLDLNMRPEARLCCLSDRRGPVGRFAVRTAAALVRNPFDRGGRLPLHRPGRSGGD